MIFAQAPSTGVKGNFLVTELEDVESPTELPARTANEYVIPGRSPVSVAVPLPLPMK